MASLLLVSIPFIAALGRERARAGEGRAAEIGRPGLVGGGLVVVVLGLILNGSLAGYGLGLPVVLASSLMLFGARSGVVRAGVVAIALASLVAIALLWTSPVSRGAATSRFLPPGDHGDQHRPGR